MPTTTHDKKINSLESDGTSERIEDTTAPSGSATSLYKDIQELNEENDDHNSATVKLALRPVSGRTDSVMLQSKIELDQSVCDSSNEVLGNRDTAMLGKLQYYYSVIVHILQ